MDEQTTVQCWLRRKELTEVSRALNDKHCVLVVFIGRDATIYAADIVPVPLVTFCYSTNPVDCTKSGGTLPKNKYTISAQHFFDIFKTVLSGKSVAIKQCNDTGTHDTLHNNKRQPQLQCTFLCNHA